MEEYGDYAFVNAYLTPDEVLVWKGHPEQGNLLLPADTFIAIFGLALLAFGIYWASIVIPAGEAAMQAFCILFIAVSVYLAVGRFLYKAYLRDKTFYAITDQKLIIRSGRNTTIYHGKDLPPMNIHVHGNGNATLIFTQTADRSKGIPANTFALENLRDYVFAQQAIDRMAR